MDLKKLENWCQEAITILGATGEQDIVVKMQRELVTRVSGTTALFEIADDLAESINDLPPKAREIVGNGLLARHGISFEFFVDKRLKKIKSIFKRGKIKNDDEFRVLSDFVSDTTVSDGLVEAASSLMASYSKIM